MYLYYYKDRKNNFGDDLNEWLWDRLLPGLFDGEKDTWMSGIGSIINQDMPQGREKIVFSSGAGYGFIPPGFGGEGWHIVSVRGPLSAKVLGLPANEGVTDGAILLSLLEEYAPLPEDQRRGIVFMPHHGALDYSAWEDVCKRADIELVSPRDESRKTMERLRSAKLVLADAMHAAIVADTLRVPWIPVEATPGRSGFKWLDWAASMELPFKPVKVAPSNLAEQITCLTMDGFGGYYAGGNTAESAVAAFEKKFIRQNKIFSRVEKGIRQRSARHSRDIIKYLENTPVIKKINDRMADQAAQSLKQASVTTQYLSDESVFQSRRSEMANRLEHAKRIILDIK